MSQCRLERVTVPRLLSGRTRIETYTDDDMWTIDALRYKPGAPGSYDFTFKKALEDLHFSGIEKMIMRRKRNGRRTTHILDVFGGAYDVVHDLQFVDSLTGVRLMNVDGQMMERMKKQLERADTDTWRKVAQQKIAFLQKLYAWQNRLVVPGNAYNSLLWDKELPLDRESRGIGNYDIIICRPQGPFLLRRSIETDQQADAVTLVFFDLLENMYKACSSEGGRIFTQIPEIPQVIQYARIFEERVQRHFSPSDFALVIYRDPASTGIIEKEQNATMYVTKTPNSPHSLWDVAHLPRAQKAVDMYRNGEIYALFGDNIPPGGFTI